MQMRGADAGWYCGFSAAAVTTGHKQQQQQHCCCAVSTSNNTQSMPNQGESLIMVTVTPACSGAAVPCLAAMGAPCPLLLLLADARTCMLHLESVAGCHQLCRNISWCQGSEAGAVH